MKKRFLTLLLTFSLLLSSTSAVFANEKVNKFPKITKTTDKFKENENEEKTYIVVLKEDSEADFASLKTAEGKKAREAKSKALINAFKAELDKADISYETYYEYDLLFAGIALKTKVKNIKKISKMASVESVEVSNEFLKPTVKKSEKEFNSKRKKRSLDSNNLMKVTDELRKKYNGQGRVVSVLDTGVDVKHDILRVSDVTKGKYPSKASMDEKMKEAGISYGSWRTDKVVYAHNYSTNGENVKEEMREESHGMHVSGISVGNPEKESEFTQEDGTTKKEKIIGTAPEAQLIFMGVFQGQSTYTHIYAKALEDSVKLGADSINLSLGAPNGSVASVGKAMDKAIAYARKMGVIVAIAAGNDGHFGAFSANPPATNPDYGTVGQPGVAKDALTVAAMYTDVERVRTISIEGVQGVLKSGDYFPGYDDDGDPVPEKNFIPEGQDFAKYNVVDAGLGNTEADYNGKNVTDKVVLVKRGGATFADKIKLAGEKGAKGVIIYNHESGGDDLISMAFGDQITQVKIPSVFIGNSAGKKILENIDKEVKFTRQLSAIPYADGGQLTDFSSYGWASDGSFKPDITAPGGLIYSSINNNKYATMSGTSMATPHIAGAVALVRESLNKRHPEIKGDKEYDIIKAIMMSTADPVKEKGTENYVSPRKQGAGAVNVEKATSTDIYVVDSNNNPKVRLNDVDSKFDINLKVVNIGKEAKTLKYKTVLGTDAVADGKFTLKTNTLETIQGSEITVPANSSVDVKITVDASKYNKELREKMPNGYFLEGFVFFEDAKDNTKEVSIAFSGFKGKWANVPLWEKPVYEFDLSKTLPMYMLQGNTYTGDVTSLVTVENNPYARGKQWTGDNGVQYNFVGSKGEIPLGFNAGNVSFSKDNLAISPNGDNNKDFVAFKGVFYRNTQYIKAKVYDENGNLVYENGSGYAYKNSNNYSDGASRSNIIDQTFWNGVKNDGTALPEGKYKYVITANSEVPGAAVENEQKLEFDVKIDVTAPVIAKPKVEGKIYKPEITDNLSGVEETFLKYIDSNGDTKWILPKDDGTFEIPDGVEHKNISIHTFDHAGNISSLNLDGSNYVEQEQKPQDLGANIRPIFKVTNYKDFEGKHIEGSENLNMFPIEINWRQDVGIHDGTGWKSMADYNYSNELVNVAPGEYSFYIVQIPEIYEPLTSQPKAVTAEKDKTKDLVFETKQKEETIPAGHGEVNIRLQIEDYAEDYMGPGATYVIKDKDGNVINIDKFKTYTKVYESPIKDDDGKLTGVNFHRAKMTVLPVGEYTAEITTSDDSLTFETKTIKFTVEENKPKKVIFKTKETIKDVVNVSFEGLDELPEGIKVTLENVDSKEKTELTQSKFNKKVFHGDIPNGKYKVTIEVPEGYKVDRETFEITVANDKVKEVVNIKKLVTLTDKDNKVTVSGYGLQEDWTLKAEVKDKNSVEKLKDSDADLYDIYFVDKDGNKVDVPEGEYNVSIVKATGKTAKAVHYVNDKGNLENIEFTQDDTNVMFKTTHFSVYAVEYAKNEEPGQPGQQPPKKRKGLVKTNLDSNVLGLVAIAVASLGMAVVVGKKRKNK
ncbi:S8 family serine peptidase [Parvimonas sp. G1967]|uniref:S8 family serine peptidase n=1 Tax=Parvimonas sp. G1967 TaxID=3387695 RepID=UPI0039E6A1E2